MKWAFLTFVTQKREGNWSRNVFRNCLWDRYQRRAGQLLVDWPFFSPCPQKTLRTLNRPRFLLAALLTLRANWFDTLTVKQWKIMRNNDVLLFSATYKETPYQQLLHCCSFSCLKWRIDIVFLYFLLRCGSPRNRKAYHSPVCSV